MCRGCGAAAAVGPIVRLSFLSGLLAGQEDLEKVPRAGSDRVGSSRVSGLVGSGRIGSGRMVGSGLVGSRVHNLASRVGYPGLPRRDRIGPDPIRPGPTRPDPARPDPRGLTRPMNSPTFSLRSREPEVCLGAHPLPVLDDAVRFLRVVCCSLCTAHIAGVSKNTQSITFRVRRNGTWSRRKDT